ncbi:2-oxoglutarate dehydrogenase E1 subunit family protein, partial [Staphylococcus simulans]
MTKYTQVSEAPVNFGANLGVIIDLYDQYLQDPTSVPEDLQILFSTINNDNREVAAALSSSSDDMTIKQVMRLIDNIRQYRSLIQLPEPRSLGRISYAVFCLKKKIYSPPITHLLTHYSIYFVSL